ncbi:hypothetical protein SAMN02787118_105132 [Streptomyces mirabilis]|uniref:Uncharacterized protein n=1 Tax=Streptomyces mirabilis TaxID=68239 RepID=A0A1I2HJI4_9ACTN|nr:hypothetical protein SAMN02787118_105132 [Streptomyces mirabilis]
MVDRGTQTPRERYRAHVRTEIRERAGEQIASAGAPALYRYCAGHDELITELRP